MFKKFLTPLSLLLIPATFFCVLPHYAPVSAIDGFVTVTSPHGGETFTEGQTTTITWDSSSNIDTVAIMYKSDAHHGNWVAFSTPNTHSYTWNVDVGNTTNTQFYIEITGYETGKGSVTNFGGYFTVNQKADSPSPQTGYSSSSTTTSNSTYTSPSTNTQNNTRYTYPWPTYIAPTPTPTPKPKPLTIYSLRWSEMFWFEGSQTTNFSNIKDPSHVDDFTIDTKFGWTYTFEETLDLTDPKKLSMLKNMNNYWSVEWWFVWVKIEWWEVFHKPATITYKDENLTEFAPTLITVSTDEKKTTNTPTTIKVKETKPGEVKAEISGGGKIEIKPTVKFAQTNQNVFTSGTTLTAHSSHRNLSYKLKINGVETDFTPKDFDEKTGEFTVPVPGLVNGANVVQLYYKQPVEEKDKKTDKTNEPEQTQEFKLADEAFVTRGSDWKKYSLIGGAAALALGAATVALLNRGKIAKKVKTASKGKKKPSSKPKSKKK